MVLGALVGLDLIITQLGMDQVEVMEMAMAMVVAMELVGKESRALLGV